MIRDPFSPKPQWLDTIELSATLIAALAIVIGALYACFLINRVIDDAVINLIARHL